MDFKITLELIEEMAECIHDCSWVSSDEIAAYMKACVTDSDNYEPEDWSVDGKGVEPIVKASINGDFISVSPEGIEIISKHDVYLTPDEMEDMQ